MDNKIDEILERLENAVQHDIILRQTQSKSGRSPKSIHLEAKAALKQLIREEWLRMIGNDLDSERKLDTDGVTQFRVSVVARGINKYKAELRKLIEGEV